MRLKRNSRGNRQKPKNLPVQKQKRRKKRPWMNCPTLKSKTETTKFKVFLKTIFVLYVCMYVCMYVCIESVNNLK
jgi:hypothetical protein